MRRIILILAVVATVCAVVIAACAVIITSQHHGGHVTAIPNKTASPATAPQGPGNRPANFGRTPSWWHPSVTATPTTTVEQWDAVDVSQIPAGSKYVAGYTNGNWPTVNTLLTAFPNAHILTIAVNTSGRAMCLDIEPGDATPSEASTWVRADEAAGFKRPCLYAPLYLWQDIWSNLNANGISRSSVWEWDAHWTYVQHLDPGFDATQWTDKSLARNLDESTVTQAMINGEFGKPKPAENPHHYSWLPNTRRTFTVKQTVSGGSTKFKVHARERLAIQHWDEWGCRNPVRRTKCVDQRTHMQLLNGRISHIAHHNPNLKKRVNKPRWGAQHYKASDGHKTTLGGAYQQFAHRLSVKDHGEVEKW